MKRVLALDTSTWWGGVALVQGSGASNARTIAEYGARVEESHAIDLLRRIESLLAQAGWTRNSIDAYVATRGPGSFTGIRVGLGTLRGLALASARPCFAVGTLDSLAEAHGPAGTDRVTCIEAGRCEVYLARFAGSGSPPFEIEAPRIVPRDEIVSGPPGRLIPGPGTNLERIDRAAGFSLAEAPLSIAAAAARIALSEARSSRQQDAEIVPLYIRPPDALLTRRGG